MLHEDMIKEALKIIQDVDPNQEEYSKMIIVMSSAVAKQHPMVAMSAGLALICGIIDTVKNEEQVEFMYHYAVGALGKAALKAGAYDKMMAVAEKIMTDEDGKRTDN